jgi:TRAP-type uncharacterized transport system substrate-binding protein
LGSAMNVASFESLVRGWIRALRRRVWLMAVLVIAIAAGAVWAAIYYESQPTVLRIAAGPEDSNGAKIVQVMIKNFSPDRDQIDLRFVPTTDARASVEAMVHGQRADLAILPSTAANSQNFPVVAILRQNVMVLIVPAAGTESPKPATAQTATSVSAAAKKALPKTPTAAKPTKNNKTDQTADDGSDAAKLQVPQLAGKRIGLITGTEASAELLNIVLAHYGIALDKVKVSAIAPANLTAAIRNKEIDVIFVAGAATGQTVTDAVAAATLDGKPPSFVAIDQNEGIARRNPALRAIDVDAGIFGGNPPSPGETFKSLSFAEYLVARRSLSSSAIAALSRLIYTSRQSLALQMPGELKITAPPTDKDADIVAHAGTLTYLNDAQKTFFDRYGDDIFYGLLIFPIFGSAVAGLMSYLRRDSRTRRLRLLQQVLDLVRKAHSAPTLEAIERIQIDAHELVIAIIHQSEREEFDDKVRMSFSFALDQLRFTIAARRAAILGSAGTTAKPAIA